MKSNVNTKVLKLAVVEILAQCGFERTTEQALNVLTDIMRYYIEEVAGRIKRSQGMGVVAELVHGTLIVELYGESEYQIPELQSFLRYQLNIKNYLSDRYNVGAEESILHILRVLPKNVHLRALMRSSRTVGDANEVEEEYVEEGVHFDEFTRGFVESSLSEQSRRVVGEYGFQFMELVDSGRREGMQMSEREFNEMVGMRRNRLGLLREPGGIVEDLLMWSDRHVFKG